MALTKLPIATVALLCCLTFTITVARDTFGVMNRAQMSVGARAEGEDGGGGMMECWTALLELKSCTNEIILFFINGEGYLGMDCCRAIRIITHHCWPSILTSLGYTSEEGDILSDYCGGGSGSGSPKSPQPAAATVDGTGL